MVYIFNCNHSPKKKRKKTAKERKEKEVPKEKYLLPILAIA